ncbi:hypothetical protein BU16DRAFT_525663 [Lophium mytilinum]|uniref:Uncharacterized protein n=1 Tax=Lophium mytilinum TaxID=390894 RepID=A0A6A6R153_9PEZI|nr:hypothetical protein BU16DRAFT_525663 [Lophium mytilinum]
MATNTNFILPERTQAFINALPAAVFKAELRSSLESSESKNLDPSSPIWEKLHPLVKQAVLDDANNLAASAAHILHEADPTLVLEARKEPKTFARFQTKTSFGGYDKHGNPSDSAWKAVNDFISFCIPTRIPDMVSNVQRLVAAVAANGGKWYVKPDKNGGQVCLEDGKDGNPKDLCCFVYAYLPAIGYVVEVQVNHPFASFTFERDSLLRDSPELKGKLVDMWDEGLYGAVRDTLLCPEESSEGDKAAVREKVAKAYATKTQDAALFEILDAEKLM